MMSSDSNVGADDLPQTTFQTSITHEGKNDMLEENKGMEERASTKSSTDKTKGDQSGQTVNPTQTHHYGLYNQGFTCYLNSVLQVLSMTTEIHHRLDSTKQTDLQLRKIFEDLKEAERGTESIRAAFGIQNVCEQRDAAECLEMILCKISPQASEVFQGALRETTKCSRGHTIIEETNEFWTLPLSLKDTHDSSYSVERRFERIFESKPCNGGNMVYCNYCEETTEAESGCEMKVFPQILTLLLKRFDDNNTRRHSKSDRCVNVPRELQRNNKQYELYAMVNHTGSLTGGHYTATIRSNEDNTWYEFDDTHVYKVIEQPFAETNPYNSRTVYLLIYRDAAPAAQRLQSYLNPGNGSPFPPAPAAQKGGLWSYFSSWIWFFFTTVCLKPDERREGEKREADNEEKTKIRQLEGDEGPTRTGVKTGEEADADTIKKDKSVGETSNDINMAASENCAELCEAKSSGHEEAQENPLRNGDGAHSSITQENTDGKLGELKQTEVDDAPVSDEEESDSRGQDQDEDTEKPKQTATELQMCNETDSADVTGEVEEEEEMTIL